jgi:hypothetical protein
MLDDHPTFKALCTYIADWVGERIQEDRVRGYTMARQERSPATVTNSAAAPKDGDAPP